MKPLTKKDMYNDNGECLLPVIRAKRHTKSGKYTPAIEDEKHRKAKLESNR